MTHSTVKTVEDTAKGERYRIVYDPDPLTPYGDALAPCWRVDRHGRAETAGDYIPPDLDVNTVQTALEHYGPGSRARAMVTRYLRIWHGVSAAGFVRDDRGEITYLIADTPAWRAHVGTDTPADIVGDVIEWENYAAGEVFGVIRERYRAGKTVWEDGKTADVAEWQEIESVYGLYGLDSAESYVHAEIGGAS